MRYIAVHMHVYVLHVAINVAPCCWIGALRWFRRVQPVRPAGHVWTTAVYLSSCTILKARQNALDGRADGLQIHLVPAGTDRSVADATVGRYMLEQLHQLAYSS